MSHELIVGIISNGQEAFMNSKAIDWDKGGDHARTFTGTTKFSTSGTLPGTHTSMCTTESGDDYTKIRAYASRFTFLHRYKEGTSRAVIFRDIQSEKRLKPIPITIP